MTGPPVVSLQCWRMERNMSDTRLIGLTIGLFSAFGIAADGYAAADIKPAVPHFASIDRPWVAIEAQEYTPPQSGPGPITYDHAHPIMTRAPNNAGVAVDAPMRIADLSN